MFDKIFKSSKSMGWIAMITMAVVVLYVVDQYRTKDFYGLAKPKA
jgi:hypothetical protein